MLHSQATHILSQGKPRSYPATLAATTIIALDKLAAADPKAANLLCLCGYLAPEPSPQPGSAGQPHTTTFPMPPDRSAAR